MLISVIIGVIGLAAGVFLIKNVFSSVENKDSQTTKISPISPPVYPEEQDDCPYNEKSLSETSSDYSKMTAGEEKLQKWRLIPRDYIVKLWKKGYHWFDILQVWDWKIPESDIPDLKTPKRIGGD